MDSNDPPVESGTVTAEQMTKLFDAIFGPLLDEESEQDEEQALTE